MAQSARREPDGFGDLVRDLDIGGVEIHVVSDEKLSGPHHRHSSRGMKFWFPNVRLPVEVFFQLLAQPFELSPPHILEIDALRPCSCRFIKEHLDAVTLPD